MVQANELRIGNWLQFESETGFRERVKVVSIGEIDFNAEGDEVFHNEKYDGPYEPIPLTPEILEKAGFQKIADEFYKKDDIYFRNYNMNLSLGSTHYILDDFQEIGSSDCKYVHQLQNLYFAVTGEELNIQL